MASDDAKPHIPVLLNPLLRECAPISGRWLDGTFGAGGYTKGLIAEGADHVTGVDRDPLAHEMAAGWISEAPYKGKIELVLGTFVGEIDAACQEAVGERVGGDSIVDKADHGARAGEKATGYHGRVIVPMRLAPRAIDLPA